MDPRAAAQVGRAWIGDEEPAGSGCATALGLIERAVLGVSERSEHPASCGALIDGERKYWSTVHLEVHLTCAPQNGAPHHGTAVALELVHPRPRASRSVVASSGRVAAAIDRYPLLPGLGTAGRGRTVRFNLPISSRSVGMLRKRRAPGLSRSPCWRRSPWQPAGWD
jgi:hypothetical protein